MSNKVNYEEMTNAELKALVDDFELTVEAKTPGKPNKAELIAAITKFKKEQDVINGVEDEDDMLDEDDIDTLKDEEENHELEPKKVAKPVAQASLSKDKKRALQRADLLRKERVIIFDKQSTQTKIPVIMVTWGNRLVGINTDVVNLQSGKPQYIRRGALANLRLATFSYSYQEDEFSPVRHLTEERFEIRELDGLTEEEIEILAAQQKLNNRILAK